MAVAYCTPEMRDEIETLAERSICQAADLKIVVPRFTDQERLPSAQHRLPSSGVDEHTHGSHVAQSAEN